MAINYTNKPLDRSLRGKDFDSQLEVRERVTRALTPLYVEPAPSFRSFNPQPFDSFALGTPDTRFEIFAAVPKGEADKNRFPMSSYSMKDWQPMEMQVSFPVKSKTADQEAVFEQIRKWHEQATHTGFGDERMEPGELRIRAPFTSKKGFCVSSITMPYPQPVSYPWLELWLRLRAGPSKSRCSKGIEFVHPESS